MISQTLIHSLYCSISLDRVVLSRDTEDQEEEGEERRGASHDSALPTTVVYRWIHDSTDTRHTQSRRFQARNKSVQFKVFSFIHGKESRFFRLNYWLD